MSSHQEKLARLVIIEGKDNRDKGKVINLKKNYVIIGRGQADINLNDLQVSRAHVALEFNENSGELQFTDLGSTNGVLVNGELRKAGTLKDRDRLKIGNTVFDCQLEFESQTEIGTAAVLRNESHGSSSESISLKGPSQLSSQSASKDLKSEAENLKELKTIPPSKSSDPLPRPAEIKKEKISGFYRQLPKSVRTIAASSALILLILFLMPSGPERNPSNRSLERYVTDIGKLFEEKKWAEAKTLALESIKAFPNHSVPQVLLGNVYFELRKIELAIEAYQKSLSLKPTQLVTYTRLIRLYLLLDKRQEAKNLLKQYLPLLESSDPNPKLLAQTGELFLDYPELEENKEVALSRAKALQTRLATSDPIGYKLEANLVYLSDNSAEGIKRSEELLKKGLEIAPKDEWIYDRLFYMKLTQNEGAESVKTLETWMKETPKSTKPLILYSYLKFNEKNYLGAIPYLQKIMNLLAQEPNHPHRAEALNLMGQISINQNQLAEAENFFRQSCQAGYRPSCAHPILTGIRPEPGSTSNQTTTQARQPSSTANKQDRTSKKK